MKVRWRGGSALSLWIPVDRVLVDGWGRIVQDLGPYDSQVAKELHCGIRKRHLPAQAFAIDLCGDDRDELLLYEPYLGEALFIFTQPDSNSRPKPYIHRPAVYNRKSYF